MTRLPRFSTARAASLVLLPLALVGCRRGHDRSEIPPALRMSGLERTGPASELSWKPVSGAAEYGVTVVGEDGTPGLWVWTGRETRVPYGVADLDGLRDDTAFIPIELPARPVRSLRPGGHYRWMVVALDAQGHARGISEVQHFIAPAPTPPAGAAPAKKGGALADVSKLLTPPASAHPCDVVPRAKVEGLLGHDPGQAQRQGNACRYLDGRLVLLTGPTSIFEGVRAMLKISPTMVDEVPGVGDGAYWMKLPFGGQLTAKKGAAGASVTVMDTTLAKERSLEVAKTIAKELLGAAR